MMGNSHNTQQTLQVQLIEATNSLDRLNEEFSALKIEKADLEKIIIEKDATIHSTKQSLSDITHKYEESNTKKEEYRVALEEQGDVYTNLLSRLDQLENKDSNKEEIPELDISSSLKAIQVHPMTANFDTSIHQLIEDSLNDHTNMLETLLLRIFQRMDILVKNFIENVEEKSKEIDNLKNQIQALEDIQVKVDELESLRSVCEKKTKRLEELNKESTDKSTIIDDLKKQLENGNHSGGASSPKLIELQAELTQQKEENKRINENFEFYKRKYQNYEEEKGTANQNYKEIIRKLSIQVEELEKMKVPSKPKTEARGLQFPEVANEKKSPTEKTAPDTPPQEKKGGFLMGMAKLFLTESDMKKI